MTISQNSTEPTAEELTSYPQDSHVNLTALQENVSRLVTSVIYGPKLCEYWGKRNPDGSWVKTSQDSLALNLEGSSVEWSMIWPRWGLASDGVCLELPILARFTGETESLLLPTTRSSAAMSAMLNVYPSGAKGRLEGVMAKHYLPTPTTQCAKGGSSGMSTTDAHSLNSMFLLPTPTASQDTKPIRPLIPSEANETHGTMLVGAIGDQLGVETGERGVLNPLFVEAMMGLPEGWTDLGHSETP